MGEELYYCRVCLQKSRQCKSLASVFRDKPPQLDYICIFNVFTRLGATYEDGLPQHLCSACCDDLVTSFNFMQLAQETDQKLRKSGQPKGTVTHSSLFQCNGDLKKSLLQKESELQDLTAPVEQIENLKVEFIGCFKDPLEESEEEDHENPGDASLRWNNLNARLRSKSETIDKEESDEDDKPLNELFKNVKCLRTHQKRDKHSKDYKQDEDFICGLANDDEDENLNNSAFKDVLDFTTSPESQIFPKGPFKCHTCGKAYFTAGGLEAHSSLHLPKSDIAKKKPRCPNKKISKGVAFEGNLEKNIENVAETPKEEIRLADKDSTSVNRIRKQKLPKPKKMFPCHVCGKQMISASKLRYHMVMHTGEKDFLCTICPKAYSTIYALKHHMRTHTGERPYECKFCGDKFTRPTTLKSHMRRHTGERPYGCDICGKRFIQHSSMTTHMKLNHMAKTIPCPHCEKKYARQTDLTTHLLSHTGDKPFSCQLCPSRFIRQANLNKHMNQHHHSSEKGDTVSNKGTTSNTKIYTKKSLKGDHKNILHKNSDSEIATAMVNNVKENIQSHSKAFVHLANDTAPNVTTVKPTSTNDQNKVENLNTIKSHCTSEKPSDNLQHPLFSQAETLMDSERFGRAMEDINRWNWSSNPS